MSVDETTIPDLHGRVFYLEKGFNQLSADVKDGFTRIGATIEALGSQFNNSGKTDWKVVGTFVGVTITIISSFVAFTKQPIENAIAGHTVEIAQLKADVALNSNNLTKNYLRTEDWRYERDRAMSQINDTQRTLLADLKEITAQIQRQSTESAKIRAEIDSGKNK